MPSVSGSRMGNTWDACENFARSYQQKLRHLVEHWNRRLIVLFAWNRNCLPREIVSTINLGLKIKARWPVSEKKAVNAFSIFALKSHAFLACALPEINGRWHRSWNEWEFGQWSSNATIKPSSHSNKVIERHWFWSNHLNHWQAIVIFSCFFFLPLALKSN